MYLIEDLELRLVLIITDLFMAHRTQYIHLIFMNQVVLLRGTSTAMLN